MRTDRPVVTPEAMAPLFDKVIDGFCRKFMDEVEAKRRAKA